MIRKIALACAVMGLALNIAPANGQMVGDEGPGPEVILGPPPDWHPPEAEAPPEMPTDPAEAEAMMLEHFFHFMDADDSGTLDFDEFGAWVRGVHMPPPEGMMGEGMHEEGMMGEGMHEEGMMGEGMHEEGTMGEGMHEEGMMGEGMHEEGMMGEGMHEEGMEDGLLRAGEGDLADLNIAPACSDELREAEQLPQAENIPCGDREGNLIFRTICNMPGYESVAISLPDGRSAACFGLEALRGVIGFEIVNEDDGSVVFDTSMGKDAYRSLVIDGPGVYQVRSTGGSPDGAVTIRFVDVPNGEM